MPDGLRGLLLVPAEVVSRLGEGFYLQCTALCNAVVIPRLCLDETCFGQKTGKTVLRSRGTGIGNFLFFQTNGSI